MKLYLFIILFFIPTLLLAQKSIDIEVMPKVATLKIPLLKHERADSLALLSLQITLEKLFLKNDHIDNLAVRYAIGRLKKSGYQYPDLYSDITTLIYFIENEYVRNLIDYLRNYMRNMRYREESFRRIKEFLRQDSLQFHARYPNADSLTNNILVHQALYTLLSFLEQDEKYQWMKEKSRDSVLLTFQSVGNREQKIWLNNGKTSYYRIDMENWHGDTISGWLRVASKKSAIKIYLDENVYQYKKYPDIINIVDEHLLLPYPDSTYRTLQNLDIPPLKRNYWNYYLDVSFAFGQGYVSKNWSAGGENSLSILSDLKYFLNYKKNNLSWENAFRYRLGALKNGNEKMSKNEDKIEVLSKLGMKAFKHWNYAAQFDMNTVLFKTYNNPEQDEVIADFLSPGYFTISLGLDYKPKNNISLYLSPIAGQWIYVRDTAKVDPTRYGVEAGKRFKSDAGAKVELRNQHELAKFMKIDNKLTLFSSYYDKPEYIIMDWQVSIDFMINYFLKTSIYMNAIYDLNHSKKLQFKETLNLGIYFRF